MDPCGTPDVTAATEEILSSKKTTFCILSVSSRNCNSFCNTTFTYKIITTYFGKSEIVWVLCKKEKIVKELLIFFYFDFLHLEYILYTKSTINKVSTQTLHFVFKENKIDKRLKYFVNSNQYWY